MSAKPFRGDELEHLRPAKPPRVTHEPSLFEQVLIEDMAREAKAIEGQSPTIKPDLIVRPVVADSATPQRVPGVPREPVETCADCLQPSLGVHTCSRFGPAYIERWGSLTEGQREWHRQQWKSHLLHIVRELALTRGTFLAADPISLGITRGFLNGERAFLSVHRCAYAWNGNWCKDLARDGYLERVAIRTENGGIMHARDKTTRKLSKGNPGYEYRAGPRVLELPTSAYATPARSHAA